MIRSGTDIARTIGTLRAQRGVTPTATLVALVAIGFFPVLVPNTYWTQIATTIWLYAVLAIGVNVVVGYAGMLTLGHAAFYGFGGYVAALLMVRSGVTWIVAFLAAGVLTGILGLLLALPCLRVQSDFLGLVTIAFGSLFTVFATNWDSITGGPSGLAGIPPATLGPIQFTTNQDYYELALSLLVVVFIVVRRLERSAVGRAWSALRDDSISASTLGVPVLYYRVLAFVIGSAIAGFAGAIYAPFITVVSPAAFNLNQSLLLVEMVIVGGLGSLPGSILGAGIFFLIPQIFQSLLVYQVGIGGAVMVLVMARRPQGLLGKTAFGQSLRGGPIARYLATLRAHAANPLTGASGTPHTGAGPHFAGAASASRPVFAGTASSLDSRPLQDATSAGVGESSGMAQFSTQEDIDASA